MKLGCFGCLFLIVLILVVVVVVMGGVFLSTNLFSTPDAKPVAFTKGDGYAAQQKIYEVILRQTGGSSRRDPIVLTEAEANAFLTRHLEEAGLRLSPIAVSFTPGELTVVGRTPLRSLFQGPPFAQILRYVPDERLDQPVWITVRGKVRIDGTGSSRYGRVDVDDFAIGKQPLGSFLLSIFLGPSGGGVLKWPLPAVVGNVEIGDRRAVITTR